MSAPVSAPVRTTGSMGRDGLLNVAGMLTSTLATFGVAMVLARGAGFASLGEFSALFAARALLVLLCGMGMRVALTRHVAAARARGAGGELVRGVALGVAAPAALSVLVAGLLAVAAAPLAEVFLGGADDATLVVLLAASLPFAVVLDLAGAASRGFQDAKVAVLSGSVLEPGLRLLTTAVAVAAGWDTLGAVAGLAVASGLAAGVAVLLLARRCRRLERLPHRFRAAELFGFSAVSWVASLATQGILWADVLILSAMVDATEVGVYQVATRVVLVALITITPLTQSLAPRIAHYWEERDHEALQGAYRSVVLWTWRLSLPLCVGVAVVPHQALRLFGSDLDRAVVVVYVLLLGAVVESFAAPSSVLLNQVGHNRLTMLINTAALALNVALNVVLIPPLGIVGAAVAWSAALVVPGVVRVLVVRAVVTHTWPFSPLHLRAAAAAGLAAVPAWLLTLGPLPWWAELVAAAVAYLVVYLASMRWALSRVERVAARRWVRLTTRGFVTRVPSLRRRAADRRLRRLPRGAERVEVDRVVSPFRYDVLARLALYEYADANRAAWTADRRAFLGGARRTLYGAWFDSVMVRHLDLEGAPKALHDRAFRQSVSRSMQLLERFDATGFDTRFPVSLVRLPAGVPLQGRALAEDRWVSVDGNHRLALLLRAGRTHLEPQEYVVDASASPRNNTPDMAVAAGLTEEELCRFYARGLVDRSRRQLVDSWQALVGHLADPANASWLAQWPEARAYARDRRRSG